ncbi:MAG TPA: two-component regulator propeller domain-containing protein [Vicinamibacterales bacterium]
MIPAPTATLNVIDSKLLVPREKMPDGLPQESITSFVQTRDGYHWFGTLDGVQQ